MKPVEVRGSNWTCLTCWKLYGSEISKLGGSWCSSELLKARVSALPILLRMLFGLIGTSATSAIVICENIRNNRQQWNTAFVTVEWSVMKRKLWNIKVIPCCYYYSYSTLWGGNGYRYDWNLNCPVKVLPKLANLQQLQHLSFEANRTEKRANENDAQYLLMPVTLQSLQCIFTI